MKQLLLAFLSLLLAGSASAQSSFIVATYNIRYQNANDGLNVWENRRDAVLGLIRFHEFDVIGLQEVVHTQLLDLARLDDFAWVGVGRDDGQQGGEYSPILYRKSRFTLIDSGTFWLSDTPDQVSFGWDAVCRRVCTWAIFKDVISGATFHLWNTHLDHKGTVAREKATALILERLKPHLDKKETVILTGDFNFTPDAPAYKKLAQALPDSLTRSKTPPYGPTGTINAFDYHTASSRRIDHIFISRDIQVLKHGTLNDTYDFRFPSDHFPVVARVVLPTPKS
ncbi:MAG TPA: endonuclease/exonuclease/phosphatase family protein [Opitutaceae bacterium]|nr:endonuclease/exonuclease/phosphatase family protein [Opitutaceae bacterium]